MTSIEIEATLNPAIDRLVALRAAGPSAAAELRAHVDVLTAREGAARRIASSSASTRQPGDFAIAALRSSTTTDDHTPTDAELLEAGVTSQFLFLHLNA